MRRILAKSKWRRSRWPDFHTAALRSLVPLQFVHLQMNACQMQVLWLVILRHLHIPKPDQKSTIIEKIHCIFNYWSVIIIARKLDALQCHFSISFFFSRFILARWRVIIKKLRQSDSSHPITTTWNHFDLKWRLGDGLLSLPLTPRNIPKRRTPCLKAKTQSNNCSNYPRWRWWKSCSKWSWARPSR